MKSGLTPGRFQDLQGALQSLKLSRLTFHHGGPVVSVHRLANIRKTEDSPCVIRKLDRIGRPTVVSSMNLLHHADSVTIPPSRLGKAAVSSMKSQSLADSVTE